MMKRLYRCGALLVALLTGILTACRAGNGGGSDMSRTDANRQDNWDCIQAAPTAESLLSTGDKQNRYLTLPGSRLVVNPYNFESQTRETTPSNYSNRPSMPLNLGYCDPFMGEGRGVELPNVLLMAERSGSAGGGVETVWEADFENSAAWQFSGSQGKDYDVRFHEGSASLTVVEGASVAWQHMESPVVTDMENAYLTITLESVSKAGGTIGVKVNDGQSGDILLLQTNTTGTYCFNLQDATQWTGEKRLNVKVFSVTGGNTVTFSNLKIQRGTRVYEDAASFSTGWRPDYLPFDAAYPNGTRVAGKDFFHDEKTVVRTVEFTGGQGFLLYGDYSGQASVSDGTVLVSRENFKYSVTVSGGVKPRFYSSVLEALAGGEGSDTPVETGYGVWAYVLDAVPGSGGLNIAVAFDTRNASDEEVAALSRKPGADCGGALDARTQMWNGLLARVPRPGTFDIRTVDALGVTGDQVKQSYYEAWVQVIGNALPAGPEIGFDYPSFAAGKASLWAYGSPCCRYTATWDSLYGMQYYVQIDPDSAWEMMKGLMSLVDDKGMIAGESLPSNNARVAWMLYTAKKDRAALAQIQPQLEKHLKWRYDNPRWIYGDSTPDPFEKDMAFVSSALIDAQYLKRINEELGLDASLNAAWDERIEKLYNNMRLWFFSPVTAYPVEYFSLQDNKRTPGNASWVTKGLHIPHLKEEECAELMRLFRSVCDTARPFCGMGPVKYEEYNYTLLGLMENGFADEARTLCETAVRDITRAGIHSEGYCYSPADTIPLPEGVRPSMFGAAMLIDNVYLMNGVRMDDGLPVLANYFDYDGSLENIQVDGASFHVIKTGNTYTYGGTAIGENKNLEAAANGLAFPFEGTGVHPLH